MGGLIEETGPDVTAQRADRRAAERTVTIPTELATALDDVGLRERFDALSYSNQRGRVTAVGSAKRDDTRQRRITSIIDERRPLTDQHRSQISRHAAPTGRPP